eukprot:6305460-Ditylum_brightwellii.AAC.1
MKQGTGSALEEMRWVKAETANIILASIVTMVGVLRWAVELGQIDIHVEVALMSYYLAMPRKGCLEQDFYPDTKEDIPLDIPAACGNSVQINTFVDTDHAGNK